MVQNFIGDGSCSASIWHYHKCVEGTGMGPSWPCQGARVDASRAGALHSAKKRLYT